MNHQLTSQQTQLIHCVLDDLQNYSSFYVQQMIDAINKVKQLQHAKNEFMILREQLKRLPTDLLLIIRHYKEDLDCFSELNGLLMDYYQRKNMSLNMDHYGNIIADSQFWQVKSNALSPKLIQRIGKIVIDWNSFSKTIRFNLKQLDEFAEYINWYNYCFYNADFRKKFATRAFPRFLPQIVKNLYEYGLFDDILILKGFSDDTKTKNLDYILAGCLQRMRSLFIERYIFLPEIRKEYEKTILVILNDLLND